MTEAVVTEGLEQRQMLAFSPTPVRSIEYVNTLDPTATPVILNSGIALPGILEGQSSGENPDKVNYTSAVLTADPENPQLVLRTAVANYSLNPGDNPDPNDANDQQTYISLAMSSDGGLTWATLAFLINNTDPTSDPSNRFRYSRAESPAAASQADGNLDTSTFYVSYIQRNAGDSAGEVSVFSFDFDLSMGSGGAITDFEFTNVYSWGGVPVPNGVTNAGFLSASQPTIAVDTTRATFTDTDGGAVVNPNSGVVYVAYEVDTDTTIANNNYSAEVYIHATSDGANYTSAEFVGFGTRPRIAISQGLSSTNPKALANGGSNELTPGQVSVVYEEFGGANVRGVNGNNSTGGLRVDRIRSVNQSAGGLVVGPITIIDAQEPVGLPLIPGVTDIPILVDTGTRNVLVEKIAVRLSLAHGSLAELGLELVAPDGTVVTLVSSGQLAGQSLGFTTQRLLLTEFADGGDDIGNSAAPYIGTFAPEEDFAAALPPNLLAAGTWILRITDVNEGNNVLANVGAFQLIIGEGLVTSTADVAIGGNGSLETDLNNDFLVNLQHGGVDGQANTPSAAAPARGVGIGAEIASDNTLGSFSSTQGALYVVRTVHNGASGGSRATPNNPYSNTDIALYRSLDGGESWELVSRKLNQDDALKDGFSGAFNDGINTPRNGRPQFAPSIAVDQSTGALAVSYYDGRFDPSLVRLARTLVVSTDGANSFLPEVFMNVPYNVTDGASFFLTGTTKSLGPVPDNSSVNNLNRDTLFDFGYSQSLLINRGMVLAGWAGNRNGLSDDLAEDIDRPMRTEIGRYTIPAGPHVQSGTTGVVGQANDTVNPGNSTDDPNVALPAPGALFTKFRIRFDRPVDAASFTTGDVTLTYRAPGLLSELAGETIALASVTPILTGDPLIDFAGAREFDVTLATAERRAGTYTYVIGGDITERVRTVEPLTGAVNPDNQLDQNGDGTVGDGYNLAFHARRNEALPILLAGPRVQSVNVVSGSTVTTGSRQVNAGITGFDVVFDRPMDPTTINAAAILRLLGPLGVINRTYTVTANPYGADDLTGNADGLAGDVLSRNVTARTYRFTLNSPLTLSGDYSIDLSPTIKDRQGNSFDPNQNAGLLSFRNIREAGSTVSSVTYTSPAGNTAIPAAGQVERNLTIPLNVSIEDINVRFSTSGATVADLTVSLVGPDGTVYQLVSGIGTGSVFTNTTIDDEASNSITTASAPFSGSFQSQSGTALGALRGRTTRTLDGSNNGTWKLRVENAGATTGQITDFALVVSSFSQPVSYRSGGNAVAIPSAPAGQTRQADRTITVPDGFAIQDLNVQFSITHASVTRLTLQLISPTGTVVELFSNVGQVGTGVNFNTTILDDQAVTRIQNSQAPFFGTFRPETGTPLAQFSSSTGAANSAGVWTLRVINTAAAGAASPAGTIDGFTLVLARPVDASQVGLAVVDQGTIGLSIFNSVATNPQAANTWLPVGPASAEGHTGRVGALTVDPSDPTGNTVYAAGASGGVWKTTNFLNSGGQPTWINLTDFGPALSLNVSSITIFTRNSNPDDSVLFVATGEGNAPDGRTPGIGFLRSLNGGRTWDLINSSDNNFDPANPGVALPINSTLRNGQFVGLSTNKVIVDPKPTPTGEVIVYAAFVGNPLTQGLYRSLDTGRTWTLIRAGAATDVVFDQNSGTVDAVANPTGNLNVIYASFRGQGVYLSPNRGQNFQALPGGTGRPLLRDQDDPITNPRVIPIGEVGSVAPTPLAAGRILLATPTRFTLADFPNNNYTQSQIDTLNLQYSGWVYALASDGTGGFDGLYLSKDFGANWTRVSLSGTREGPTQPYPTNNTQFDDVDTGAADFVTGEVDLGQGANSSLENSMVVAVDPTNPAVVYIGGAILTNVFTGESNYGTATLVRVDTTFVADPYAMYSSPYATDGGETFTGAGTGGPAGVNGPGGSAVVREGLPADRRLGLTPNGVEVGNPFENPGVNLIRNPLNPNSSPSTVEMSDVLYLTNNGTGATYTFVGGFFGLGVATNTLISGRGSQELILRRDPISGGVRFFIGNNMSVFTGVVDPSGKTLDNIDDTPGVSPGYAVVDGNRAGNLQLSHVIYGAVQPSDLAAQVAGALFYANTNDIGDPQSDPNILTNGNTRYDRYAPTLDSGATQNYGNAFGRNGGVGVFTNRDDANRGTAYKFRFPEELGGNTEFFQLISPLTPVVDDAEFYRSRTIGLLQSGDNPQGGTGQWAPNAVANFAVNPLNGQQVIISSHAGRIYSTSNSGQFWLAIGEPATFNDSQALALAFGAPDPDPLTNPTGALNNHLYVGTVNGEVFVTYDGGGEWTNITANIPATDGEIRSIFTSPNRGRFDVYVTTDRGIYYKADSRAGGTWTNVTGNLFALTRKAFGNEDLTETFLSNAGGNGLRGFRAMVADYRYSIPLAGGGSAPMLYVAGYGGVFRSIDNGTTWSAYPSVAFDGSPEDGGYMPNVQVTDLDLSVGEIDPTTGRPLGYVDLNDNGVFDPGEAQSLDLLLASTFGRGQFAIRLAPVIVPATLGFDATSNVTALPNGEFITTSTRPIITGVSQQSGFGSVITVDLLDLTDPNNPVVIGSGVTDEFGRFSIQLNNGAITIPGSGLLTVPIGVRATSASGTVGNIPVLTVNFDTVAADLAAPVLRAASDSGSSNADRITSVSRPFFDGAGAESGATISLFANGTLVGTAVADASGNYAVQPTAALADGTYSFTVKQTDAIGNTSVGFSTPAVSVTVDTTAPAAVPSAPVLTAATDTGASSSDNITSNTTPTVTGTTTANGVVQVLVNGVVVSTVTANGAGVYTATVGTLAVGANTITARLIDVAGNAGTASAGTVVTVDTTAAALAAPALAAASDTGTVGDNQTGLLRPSFTGSGAEPGATVRLFVGGILAGSAVALGDGTYTVTPTADLTPGTRSITVVQVDVAGNVSAASPALSVVVDPTAPNLVGGVSLGASEDVSVTATIGTVSVTSPLTIFSVTVNWGDGTPADVLIVGQTGASNISLVANGTGFNIVGTHTYLVPGSYTITLTAVASTGGVSTATSSATVVNLPIGAPGGGVVTGGFAISAVEGAQTAAQTVATFTDPGGTGTPSDYVVTIDWGDGTTTNGTVTFNAGSGVYTVTGQNTYANTGVFTITVSVSEGGNTSTAVSTATVTNAALTIGTATPIIVNEGGTFSGPVITFTNAFTAEPIGQLTATIVFGDGSTAQGVITTDPLSFGTYVVSTTKTFADNGVFNGTVTITDNDGGSITGNITSTIANVAPTTSATAPANTFAGDPLMLAITGGDVGAADLAAGLTYVIDWGDGSPFDTTGPAANNTAAAATHIYTATGTYTVTVNVTDKDGGTSSFSTSVTVLPQPTVSAPTINGGASPTGVTSRVTTVAFTISASGGTNPVVTSSNITMLRNGTQPVDISLAPFTYDQTTGVGSLDLTNTALADGDYQVQITLSAGTVLPLNFTKLTGDVDGSGRVDSKDRRIVQQRQGSTAVSTDSADLDGDGVVDVDDLNIVKANNGRRAVLRTVRLNLNSRRGPTINFDTVRNANGGVIEITVRNNFRQARTIGELRAAGEDLVNAQIIGRAWNAPLTALTLQPGETVRVRVYLNAPTNPGRPLAGNVSLVHSNVTGLDSRRVESSIRGKFRF